MTNQTYTTLYVGVTGDLKKRVHQHREGLSEGFTKRYQVTRLVLYEILQDAANAILREKQVKAGSRQKKVNLIEAVNPSWRDLYDDL
jgi:putative endonuclease